PMSELLRATAIGTDLTRVEGPAKVRGRAPYAYEHPLEEPLHLHPLCATIARGRVSSIDASAASALDGVVRVITHHDAPRLADTDDGELAILQDERIGFRGQYLGAVLAETPEIARQAADLVVIETDAEHHDAEFRPDHPGARAPEGGADDVRTGQFDTALAAAEIVLDQRYSTPIEHNNPMEPHTTSARWDGDTLTLWTSTQGAHPAKQTLAPILGIHPERLRIISPHVGGGFGSKGLPHADMMLAALAAQVVPGRAVKYAVTRQHMFAVTGYRPRPRSTCGSEPGSTAPSPPSDSTRSRCPPAPRSSPNRPSSPPGRCTPAPIDTSPSGCCPWTWRCPRGCAPPGRRPAWSAWRSPWTSWQMPATSTPSSCGRVTSPSSTPTPACRSTSADCSTACARAPSASAGP